MNRQKFLALVLTLALVCALLPTTALADSDFIIEDGVLTEYTGPGGDVVIPDGVTTIGNAAFWDYDSLTSVTIPASVTAIEEFAFSNCSSLTSVTIPASVTSIGGDAFSYCASLTSVTLPDSVTTIGDDAFEGCIGLTSVTIPGSVTSIGDYVFQGTPWWEGLEGEFVTVNGILLDYRGKGGEVVIPDGVTTIGSGAFRYCDSLTSVTIPDSVTSIGNSAFYYCDSLISVTIPDSVTTIEWNTFYACTGLTSVTIPANVTTIGYQAFYACTSLTSVTIPASVTSIGEDAFSFCDSLTVYGYTGTEAEAYCENLGIPFVSINGSEPSPSPLPSGGSSPASEQFTDVVKGSWYEPGVTYVVVQGLFQGMAEGVFSPDTNMNRAMVMTVLARMDGQDTTNATDGPWYANIMDWAKAKDISDGTMPEEGVTREQLVVMLYRYAKPAATAGDLTVYADGSSVSPWAENAMVWAVNQGILTGKNGGLLDPRGFATRAEVATIFQRFVEKTGK